MKPMIKYRGGKLREIPSIIRYIPHFSGRYVEPFFGGGALFFHLEPRAAIIGDINEKLMGFYRGVRDEYPALRNELDKMQRLYSARRRKFDVLKAQYPSERVEDGNEALYYRLRDQFNGLREKHYSDAALYYYINKTAYSGMIRYNANGEFNVPYGRYPHLNTEGVTLAHSLLLRRADIYSGDYERIFGMCRADDFVFLDPPYDCTFSDYGNNEYRDGFTEEEHRRLAAAFYALPCKALLVIGKTPMIEKLYGGSIVHEYGKSYAVNIRNRFKSTARHVIVTNCPAQRSAVWEHQAAGRMCPVPGATQLSLFGREERYGTY